MLDRIIGQNNVIVTAHPDDESLWCGGLPIRFHDRLWTVICCSIPRTDPIRAWKFLDACRVLGAAPRSMPFTESEPGSLLPHLNNLGLSGFDCVVTHNPWGEYGHVHHRQVHEYVSRIWYGPLITFGYRPDGRGREEIRLTPSEMNRKLQALMQYDHKLPYNGQVMTKWEALIKRYQGEMGIDLSVETYDVR